MIITAIAGVVILLFYFIPRSPFDRIGEVFQNWVIIVAAFAIILGVGSLVKVNGEKISRLSQGWGYSVVLLVGLFTTALIGIIGGIEEGSAFDFIFKYFFTPMGSTMFSLLAFFIASAAFRAFRAKTFEAGLLLASAFLVMLGRVPIGDYIWHKFPEIASWIMDFPNTAGQRAIMIGASLGVVSTSIKFLLGIDKSYLGGE